MVNVKSTWKSQGNLLLEKVETLMLDSIISQACDWLFESLAVIGLG